MNKKMTTDRAKALIVKMTPCDACVFLASLSIDMAKVDVEAIQRAYKFEHEACMALLLQAEKGEIK